MVEELYQDQNKFEQGGPSHTEGKREGGSKDPHKLHHHVTKTRYSHLYIILKPLANQCKLHNVKIIS